MLIDRPDYLDRLEALLVNEQVKVLTGVRRCGKSTVLDMFADRLRAKGVPETNIVRRRFDGFSMPLGYTGEQLRQDLATAFDQAQPGTVYVFLDEIQDVPDWELVVRRLHTRPETDVYITGSNAGLLSGELATYLAGRYIEIEVYPLAYAEYCEFRHQLAAADNEPIPNNDELFLDYMHNGGMPGLYRHGLPSSDEWRGDLNGIYDSVVVGDVATRRKIRDLETLRELAQYMFSVAGSYVNASSIAGELRQKGIDISSRTISEWLKALQTAFILYPVRTQNLRGRQLLSPEIKWYPVDNAFRNLVLGDVDSDRGHQLESIVYIELLRRGYQVEIGRINGKEIDFVARKGHGPEYIQVTWEMSSERVRERELAPLQLLDSAFPRTVITMNWSDTIERLTPEGIRIVHATDWLLNKTE